MTAEVNTEVSSTRRDELLRLAARIFAERGYATTTTRDIAVEANIRSGSLYHHFDSKESMLDDILRPYFAGLDELVNDISKVKAPAVDKVKRLILETHQLSFRYRDAALIYSHDGVILRPIFPYIQETLDRIEQLWLRTLRAGIKNGSFAADLEPAVVYRTMIGATSFATQWFRPDASLTIEQISEIQTRLLIDGLRAR